MVASQRTQALPLVHLRSVGGGPFCVMRETIRTHLVGWLLALGVGACGPSNPGHHPASGDHAVTLTDDAGRSIVVSVPVRRIVSLAPSITELLFAIGAGDRVVGRTVWCRYPPAASLVPAVGDGLNPDVEIVAARHPDLVLLYRSALTEVAARQLQAMGIPALILRHDRIEDVSRSARLLGSLTGNVAAGDSIAVRLDRLRAVGPPPSATGRDRSRVAFVVWDAPPIVIGGGSYLDELTILAGGENVFHDLASASATVSLETIAARDPAWIAVLTDSAPQPPSWARRPEWQVVRAVREGRFLYLPGNLFGQPSPRAPRAVATLRRWLESVP
jgi:iron complex transport system substrate-binding protein